MQGLPNAPIKIPLCGYCTGTDQVPALVMWLCGIGIRAPRALTDTAVELVWHNTHPEPMHRWLLRPEPWPQPPCPTPRQLQRLRRHLRRYRQSRAQLGTLPVPTEHRYLFTMPVAANGTVVPVDLPRGPHAHYPLMLRWPSKGEHSDACAPELEPLLLLARPCQYAPGHLRFYPPKKWYAAGPGVLCCASWGCDVQGYFTWRGTLLLSALSLPSPMESIVAPVKFRPWPGFEK